MTYTYTDGDLKGTVSLDNTDPTVGDTITATVTGANVPENKLTYQWVKVKDGSETSIDGATGSTYTATDDDAGYELVCKVSSTDDICLGTICGATGAVKKIQAFAVYSADDNSLNFYKRASVPSAGDTFNGKTATAVYTGIENKAYSPWWSSRTSKIKTATVVDDGLQPFDLGSWFYGCKNMTACDLDKLDTSNVTDMGFLFKDCSSLTTLDLSSWNTSNVTNMKYMFLGCKSLTSLGDLSSWNTSNVTDMTKMFYNCSKLSVDCSNWDVSKVTYHGMFNGTAPGVTVPLAWQAASDEGIEDSAIAPLCEEQGNGDVPGVASENDNDEAVSKTDGEASADSETEGNATTSADDVGAKEETSDDIVQEEPAAA